MLKKIKTNFIEARSFLTYAFLGSVSKALSAVLPLIIAKIFNPEIFGSYSLLKMLIFFFSALTISSIQRPFIVFANEELKQTGKISRTFTIKLIVTAACLAMAACLAYLFANQISNFAKVDKAIIPAVFWGFTGFVLCGTLSDIFLGLGQQMKCAMSDLSLNLSSTIIIVILCLSGKVTLSSAFMVNLYAFVGVAACMAWQIDYKKLMPLKFDLKHTWRLLDFAKWIFVGVTASYFINWGDNLVLRYYAPMDDIGNYNFAYQISKTIMFLTATIYFYFLPYIVQNINNKAKITHYLCNKRPKIFVMGAVFFVILYFLLPYLVEIVYGDSYHKSQPIFRLLLISNLVNLYVIFLPGIFESLKYYKSLNIIAMTQLVLNLLFDLILIPQMGIVGAAIATNIGYIGMAIIMEIYFRKCILKEVKNG
jgi:O-antigen/teichoic acid export membrane protein